MGFKSYRIQLLVRLALLVVNSVLFSATLFLEGYWLLKANLLIALMAQIYIHFRFLSRWQRDLGLFATSVKYNDYSIVFRKGKEGDSFPEVYDLLNGVTEYVRKIKSESVQQYEYFRHVVENAQVGILAYDQNGKVVLSNKAALEYAGVSELKQLLQLKDLNRQLYDQITTLRPGMPRLLTLKGGQVQKISARLSQIAIEGENLFLLSLLNINPEIEENELQSWQDLINVLTHEIMNSVTPIHSLSGNMTKYLDRIEGNEEAVAKARTSLDVIGRRSSLLMDFVNRYREVSNVPIPNLQTTSVSDLILSVLQLFEEDLKGVKVFVTPNAGVIEIDTGQIEQVLINLIRNALQSMKESSRKELTIFAVEEEQTTRISVTDTGIGIPHDVMDKIFIPFFTTRKDGSGIGLTLSKQVMHRHGGQILVSSTPGKGTSFTLVFNHPDSKIKKHIR